jgi:hypothetical protein
MFCIEKQPGVLKDKPSHKSIQLGPGGSSLDEKPGSVLDAAQHHGRKHKGIARLDDVQGKTHGNNQNQKRKQRAELEDVVCRYRNFAIHRMPYTWKTGQPDSRRPHTVRFKRDAKPGSRCFGKLAKRGR